MIYLIIDICCFLVPKEVPSLMMKDPTLVPCQKLSREIQHVSLLCRFSSGVLEIYLS